MGMTKTSKTYTAITSKLGVHVDSITRTTRLAAERAARRAIKDDIADSAAIYFSGHAISYFGSGR